jgi:tungstate transport system ATP-binding protein
MTTPGPVSFSAISHSFGSRKVLDNIGIDLQPGKVMLLSGENGSGKTTLLRIIAGLLKPDTGYVETGSGLLSWKKSQSGLINNFMYLHQTPYMFEGSVYRNLSIATKSTVSKEDRKNQVLDAMEWAMLGGHRFASAKTLSGGQQQRVSLARAWLRQPPFILLDEPTTNMDSNSARRTILLLEKLKHANIGLIISSHSKHLFDSLVDHHLELRDFQLISRGEQQFSGNVTPISRDRDREVL